SVLAERELLALKVALRELHEPSSEPAFRAARRRVALEPMLVLQSRLLDRRRCASGGRALAAIVTDAEHARIVRTFPFELTAGQRAIASDLRADLAREHAMRRLLQ